MDCGGNEMDISKSMSRYDRINDCKNCTKKHAETFGKINCKCSCNHQDAMKWQMTKTRAVFNLQIQSNHRPVWRGVKFPSKFQYMSHDHACSSTMDAPNPVSNQMFPCDNISLNFVPCSWRNKAQYFSIIYTCDARLIGVTKTCHGTRHCVEKLKCYGKSTSGCSPTFPQ